MNDTTIQLHGVSRVHAQGSTEVVALDDVTLTVGPGEFVAITGRSGSGKSTLLNIMAGLDLATSGSVRVCATDVGLASETVRAEIRRKRVGVVFQQENLIPTLTAVENVALPLELDGDRPRAAHVAAVAALRQVDAERLAERFPDELSGGEQQRVAIARGVVGGREVVLADEPTGALDEVTGERILAALRRLADEGRTVVIATHDPAHAGWADRVVRLRDGGIESVVAADRVGSRHGHVATGEVGR